MFYLKRAQSTIEFAVALLALVGALVAMQVYVTRGMQGKMRETADSIGEQYAPGNTTADIRETYNYEVNSVTTTTENAGLTTTVSDSGYTEQQNRTGNERVRKY